jgi:multisubunit Na+/H+ antiporter MnhF subunit
VTGYEVCTVAVMIGALGPALLLAATGRPVDRLIGLELTSAAVIVSMLLVSQVTGMSYMLIVPLVLTVLSVVGTLVFTRLIDKDPHGS